MNYLSTKTVLHNLTLIQADGILMHTRPQHKPELFQDILDFLALQIFVIHYVLQVVTSSQVSADPVKAAG